MDQFLPDGNQHNDSDAYVAVSSYTGEITGLKQNLNNFYTWSLPTEERYWFLSYFTCPYICSCKTRNHRVVFWKKVSLQLKNDKLQILYQEVASTEGQHTMSGILQWIKIKHRKHQAAQKDDLVTCLFLITLPLSCALC